MDAEFMAQTFCLTAGWREPNTLQALRRAVEEGLLPPADGQSSRGTTPGFAAWKASCASGVLSRETELPDEDAPLHRVAVRCGFDSAAEFMQRLKPIRAAIRAVYQTVFPP